MRKSGKDGQNGDWNVVCEEHQGFVLTFGLSGFIMGMSVPSALCLLESNTFLFFTPTFRQMVACFFYRETVVGATATTTNKAYCEMIQHVTKWLSEEIWGFKNK